MPTKRAAAPAADRKRRGHYHHGDLRRALLDEALRTIRDEGVRGLTLRTAGSRLGVSRTALYRHFTDKAALLRAVATEGFRMLREQLLDAWVAGGAGPRGFEQMGLAYVRFAVANPSHYRVMFGGFVRPERDAEFEREATGAFQALVDALLALQASGHIVRDDPQQLARFIWSVVHGIAMLAIDGQLAHAPDGGEGLARYAIGRIATGISME